MKNFKKSKTYENLQKAFTGESEAYIKYQYYASQAKKDGYVQIADIFDETAHNEKEHGKIWFKLLNDNQIPDTISNLIQSIATEKYEAQDMYINFAEIAYKEGYENIGNLFEKVAAIEQEHCKRYDTLLNNIRNNTVFHKNNIVSWKCNNCGHIHIGYEAPKVCPVCSHPQAYFEVQDSSYI